MKPILKKIDGILLLNKPLHLTSNSALQNIKRKFRAKKAGHTGSLDPLATGMLPICFGEATKVSQFLLDSHKYYEFDVKLGERRTTGDAEGEIVETKSTSHVTLEKLEAVLQEFLGEITQIPPMFSALKFKGKPLYELARQGIEIERPARNVKIFSLDLIKFENDIATLKVHCSKGTYVRTLAEDIGTKLKCGGYVARLHRTAVSPYQDNKMYTFDEIEKILAEQGEDGLLQCLLPIDSSVQHLPSIKLSPSASFYLKNGQRILSSSIERGLVRIFSEHAEFLGIGEILADGNLISRRLIA